MTSASVMPATASANRPGTREAWGDVAKGALIIGVVLWHVVMKSFLTVDWHLGVPLPGAWGLAADMMWPFLMPLFLLVSGYFASNAFTRPWSVVFRPRILRFFYLYLLWSLIHMAALWAFPDFPTLIPRSVTEVVEFLTISPPNTWYLYALALYFLAAKALARVPAGVVIGVAGAVSVAVSSGYVDVVSNRGSLLYNFTFFLVGLHGAPQIRRLVQQVTMPRAALGVAAYVTAFFAMRLTGSETVPGVWLLVSVLGVAMGLCLASQLSRARRIGPWLSRLGQHSLPIYLLHMPLLAVVDAATLDWLSTSRVSVQLVAAVLVPVLVSATLVAVCLLIDHVVSRDGFAWLWDVPGPLLSRSRRRPEARRALARRGPWRSAAVVALLLVCGFASTRVAAIPGCLPVLPSTEAQHEGQVSIGATGDLLIHDVGHSVPSDGGLDYFDAVRPWFTQDLVTGNLEQAITSDTGHDKCGDSTTCLAFRSAPETAGYFTGFDLLNLANNHTKDFGNKGYANTRENLKAHDIRSVGDRNEIACSRIGDTTVAVIGFAPYAGTNNVTDLRHVRKVVAAAAGSADIVIVQAHMGGEGADANTVTPGMERMYGENRGDVMAFSHAAVDAGADLVLGHGPHSLRGMEFYQGRLIAYSLGNFGGGGVFGVDPATRFGVYLDATLNTDGTFAHGQLKSISFDDAEGAPFPDNSSKAARLVANFGHRDFPETTPHIDSTGTLTPPTQ